MTARIAHQCTDPVAHSARTFRLLVYVFWMMLAAGCAARHNAPSDVGNGVMAFEVGLNGEHLCTAAVPEDHGVVSIITNLVQCDPAKADTCNSAGKESITIHAGGLTTDRDGRNVFLEWAERHLELGDELRIKVIRTADVDPPTRKPDDSDDSKPRPR